MVALWWGSAVLAVITSKVCLSRGMQPMHLSLIQFSVATALLWLVLRLRHNSQEIGAGSKLVRNVAATYAAAFMLTNLAFSLSSTPFVETIKAGEPVSTCLLAALWLREVDSLATYLTLLPIVAGVALASYSAHGAHSGHAFVATVASNIGFSARAVLAKRLKKEHPESPCAKSDIVLFYHVSRIGLCFIAPVVLTHDGYCWLMGAAISTSKLPTSSLVGLACLNGICFAIYNCTSFAVLSRVSANSHAVFNLLRRVVIISTSTIFFSLDVSLWNICGIAIALAGGLLYAKVKFATNSRGRNLGFYAGLRTSDVDKLRIV
uniref:Sugar phosphate transporter domain-containing protein n=1 Tax=Strombidinopsis acuminata TaxID=141414 RepID=A0A7S3TD27_9SPIT